MKLTSHKNELMWVFGQKEKLYMETTPRVFPATISQKVRAKDVFYVVRAFEQNILVDNFVQNEFQNTTNLISIFPRK